MSNKGFSLLEVLIAFGIASILMIAVNKLALSALTVTKAIEAKTGFNSLVQNIEFVLKDKSLCSTSLYNQSLIAQKSRALFSPDNTVEAIDLLFSIRMQQVKVAEINQTFQGIYISKLNLVEIDRQKREPLSPTQTKYLAGLHVEALLNGDNPQGKKFSHDFFLWVTTKDNVIESCEMKSEISQNTVQIQAPSTGWVKVNYDVTVPAGCMSIGASAKSSMSAEKICQKAGYNTYLSSCKGMADVNMFGILGSTILRETEGSLSSSTSTFLNFGGCSINKEVWDVSCSYTVGNGSNITTRTFAPSQILCSK